MLRLHPDTDLKLDELNDRGYLLLNSTITSPWTTIEIPTKNYVDNKFNDPSIIRNNAHLDFNDKNLDNVRFVKVNNMSAVREHLIPKYYVDQATFYRLDELSLLRLDPDEQLKLDEQDSINLNSTLTSPKSVIELPTKSYVDSLHESSRNRRDSSSVFNDQDIDFDKNKLTNLDSITVIRDPNSDNELANKNYIGDSIGEGTIVRFNQTLVNYLKVSVGNDTYNLTKYDRKQITDTTIIK